MKISKIRKSRDGWKEKAKRRGSAMRELRKMSKTLQKRMDQNIGNSDEIRRLKEEIARLNTSNNDLQMVSAETGSEIHRRTLCVIIVVFGIVSFRSVPRILKVFLPLLKAKVHIPHFTSVIHWTLRAGVAVFNQVSLLSGPWMALVDCSIDVGTRKALVVLRIPLGALQNRTGAVGLQDCECIGLEVSHKWNGKLVSEALGKIFGRSGFPLAIIKDGGTDLNKGVELLRDRNPSHKIHVIEDVGHYTANALKAAFAKAEPFVKFLDIVSTGASRIRQTTLAWLLPPKIRSKGRFQGITAVAKWAQKMLDFIGGQGRAKDGTDLSLARKAFVGLAQLRPFLTLFCGVCAICEEFQKLLKIQGLNQATYVTAKKTLEKLSDKSLVKFRLSVWLEKHICQHRKLGIGDLPLLVSSDIIESLFGKFKTIIQRNPLCELNRLVYIIPLLCGNHSIATVDSALKACSHAAMLQHIEQTIPPTLRQQRAQELARRSTSVPKAGNSLVPETS